MGLDALRRNATLAYGVLVAVAWSTVGGPVATIVTVVGAFLLGLAYTFGGRGEGWRNRGAPRGGPGPGAS